MTLYDKVLNLLQLYTVHSEKAGDIIHVDDILESINTDFAKTEITPEQLHVIMRTINAHTDVHPIIGNIINADLIEVIASDIAIKCGEMGGETEEGLF